jgi:raffinose/stachyose/melibiose transport system substrate-binding protein
MKKKFFGIFICVFIVSGILAGCAGNSETGKNIDASNGTAIQGADNETLSGTGDELKGKLVVMTNSSGGTYDAVESIVNEFTKLHPGVEIEFSSQGSDYEALMKAKMAANDLPDVFATHGWSVNRYSEYLFPLNGEEWYPDLVDEIISVISDEDGNVYTLPLNVDKAGIIYNYRVLEEIGCKIPVTWDEFLSCCDVAKTKGYTPVYLAGKDEGKIAGILNILFNSFLVSDDSNSHADDLKSGNVEASVFEPVLDFITTLKDNGYFNVDYVTADSITIPEKLAGGEVLFAMESNSTMADAYALNPDATLSMMPVPAVDQEVEPFLTGGEKEAYGVWKDSKNKELALALLDYMAQPENIEKVSAGSGMPVSMKNAANDLGKIQESYDTFSAVRVLNKFDRECFPNGMWSTMKTVGSALVAGNVSSKEASEMFFFDYQSFMSQNN